MNVPLFNAGVNARGGMRTEAPTITNQQPFKTTTLYAQPPLHAVVRRSKRTTPGGRVACLQPAGCAISRACCWIPNPRSCTQIAKCCGIAGSRLLSGFDRATVVQHIFAAVGPFHLWCLRALLRTAILVAKVVCGSPPIGAFIVAPTRHTNPLGFVPAALATAAESQPAWRPACSS